MTSLQSHTQTHTRKLLLYLWLYMYKYVYVTGAHAKMTTVSSHAVLLSQNVHQFHAHPVKGQPDHIIVVSMDTLYQSGPKPLDTIPIHKLRQLR